jgi:hypothetical protein
MVIETYDISSGDPIQKGNDLSIGDIIQNQHIPIVFRCLEVSSVTIALLDKGLSGNEYSYFINTDFIPNVSSATRTFTPFTSTPVSVPISSGQTSYVWIDIKADPQNSGPAGASFQISYA